MKQVENMTLVQKWHLREEEALNDHDLSIDQMFIDGWKIAHESVHLDSSENYTIFLRVMRFERPLDATEEHPF